MGKADELIAAAEVARILELPGRILYRRADIVAWQRKRAREARGR